MSEERHRGLLYMPNDWDRRAPEVEKVACELAWDRGGQTMPLCSYDLDRAEEIVTGRKNLRTENARLRKRVAELEAAADLCARALGGQVGEG